MKKIKKIGAVLFISSYILIGFSLASSVVAADQVNFTPQETIPGSSFQQGTGVSISEPIGPNIVSDLLGRYIAAVYNWGLSIVGAIGVLMLMIAGVIWITSGGDTGKIAASKKMIGGSLGGMALLIGAWFLLNTINPNLTTLPALKLDTIKKEAIGKDGFVDNAQKISYVCLSGSLTCANTVPPSLNVELQTCYNKFGQSPNTCLGTASPIRFCCGINSNTQAKADTACVSKKNGTACTINETAVNGSGYCFNNKCKPCTYFGSACTNNYECLSASLLQCGYGDTTDVNFPSKCNSGYCANYTSNNENDSCGANNAGKCLKYTGLYACPGNTQAFAGGTDCGSGLKCCK